MFTKKIGRAPETEPMFTANFTQGPGTGAISKAKIAPASSAKPIFAAPIASVTETVTISTRLIGRGSETKPMAARANGQMVANNRDFPEKIAFVSAAAGPSPREIRSVTEAASIQGGEKLQVPEPVQLRHRPMPPFPNRRRFPPRNRLPTCCNADVAQVRGLCFGC